MRKKSFSSSMPLFISFWAIITTAILIALAVFGLFGYRLAIVENARPDWDGINTVISWLIAPLTVTFAIAASILIPILIARRQNIIALFERRYAVYSLYFETKKYLQKIGSSYVRAENLNLQDSYLLDWVATKAESHPDLNLVYYDIKNSINTQNLARDTFLRCTHSLDYVLILDMQLFRQGHLLFENDRICSNIESISKAYEKFVRILINNLYSYYNYSFKEIDDSAICEMEESVKEMLNLVSDTIEEDFELDLKQTIF